ncbi:cytochrome P450 67 [Lentithecium fluviatile CBS 122367]|uniref:Cytochrome P450 67 n=1 Tax=Lentithecium fluviatile CBS 122367 TaxID=1168545 RepID=A0A6G1JGU2_9PLEO|nr:cytochrome P450 67 [Lentithecium fluviatile CBS 122367]
MSYVFLPSVGMASSDLVQGVRISALLGAIFHASINRIEFELYMFHFLASYAVAFVGFTFNLTRNADLSFSSALAKTCLTFAGFNAGALISIAVYRLFFHRCRKFDGPLLARLTRFYATYLNGKDHQYSRQLGKLHENYGDVVRTGPREISVLDKAAIPLLYGPNSECTKAAWYGQSGNDNSKVSINMTRDTKQYRLRRRAWDRGFSIKALATYQPRIKNKVDAFIEQLQRREGSPTEITKWANLFAFDVMGEIGFGKDFHGITSGEEHPAIKGIHEHVAVLGLLQTVPWLLNLLSAIPGAAAAFSEFFGTCKREMDEKESTWDSEKEPQDIASWLLKAIKDQDTSASPTKESLADDSRVMIIAGTDTTAITLANILFYLAKHQSIQRKLQMLVDSVIPAGYSAWDYEKAKTVSYIDDIINETLRLKPPILQGSPRETPAQGLQIGNVHVPGGVNVSVPYFLIQRDPRWWQQPNDFVPERWGEKKEEMGTDGAPFLPFQLGLHSCAGKNLAYLTLRTVVSAIMLNFDVEFAPGETGEAFDKFVDNFIMSLPPLKLRFGPRCK